MSSLRIKHFKINNKVIYTMFLICLFADFGGAFGIRYASLLFTIFYLSLKLANGDILIPKRFLIVEGTLFIFFPMIIVLYSTFVYNTPITTSLSQVNTFFLWIVYLILINLNSKQELLEPFKKVGYGCAKVVIGTFIILYVLITLGQFGLIDQIQAFTYDYRLGFIGRTPSPDGLYYTNDPNVYYRWTMILIPISLMFIKENKRKFLIIVLSMVMANSTGLLLFSLLGIALFFLIDGFVKRQFAKSIFLLFTGFIVLLGLSLVLDMSSITDKLSSESASTSTKIGHIQSALKVIFDTPWGFLFGTGLGSSFYSAGINAYTSEIEVSHINMIRQFGILYFVLFFLYIITVFVRVMKIDETGRMLGLGLLSFFIAAGTNPLLLSPMFIIFLVITKSYIVLNLKEKNKIKNESKVSIAS